MPGRYTDDTDEFTGTPKNPRPFVLHNTQLLHGSREGGWAGEGAGVSDLPSVSKSFCLSFKWKPCSIIHEGAGTVNVPYSWLVFWSELTPCHRWWETKGRQRAAETGNYFIPTLLERPSAFIFLCVIIRPTRPRSGDAFEDTDFGTLMKSGVSSKTWRDLCPSLCLVFMLHAVKEPLLIGSLYIAALCDWLFSGKLHQLKSVWSQQIKSNNKGECRSEGGKDLKMFLKRVRVAKGEQIFTLSYPPFLIFLPRFNDVLPILE